MPRKTHIITLFFPSVVREWNLLPRSVRNLEHLDEFKRALNKTKPKRNELYQKGERTIAVIHARMRMGCSQLNSDLHRIGVVESPSCSCGADIENIYHFFFQCSKYVLLRNELQSEITNLGNFNLNTILFGNRGQGVTQSQNEDIFNAVQKFIKNSGRFKK